MATTQQAQAQPPPHPTSSSEDSDSIMTDEIEDEHGLGYEQQQFTATTTTSSIQDLPGSSASHSYNVGAMASTSSSAAAPGVAPPGVNLRPSGPVCEFGDRLGYTYFSKPLPTAAQLNTAHRHTETFWLTVDNDLTYLSFFRDTGPLNVGCLYRFCLHLHELLDSPQLQTRRIILFSSDDADKKANAALLMALYAMIVLRWSPADALHPIACLELQPFRDAGYARADFHLSCQDVLFGARKAIDNRLLKLDEFNIQEYEYYEKVENGDWNYITPHFLAFASPVEPGYDGNSSRADGGRDGSGSLQPKISKSFRNVLEYFQMNGVKMVVRLNKKLYDERRFLERGMEHREMYFDDGTNPTMEMCREFIDLSEAVIKSGGVVAVHCKAGLGRTGTLIGAYLIYKYGFTACEVIGFMRLMRPGTCVGPQQHFMYENQMTWVKWGAIDRYKSENPQVLVGVERPITPPTDDESSRVSAISTPRATTPLVCPNTISVPGQPRKTPGAKTRHTHAAPEVMETSDAKGAGSKTGSTNELEDVFTDSHSTVKSVRTIPPSSPAKGGRQRSVTSSTNTTRREHSATPSAAEKDEEMQLVVDEVLIVPQRRQPLSQPPGRATSQDDDVKPSREELSENAAPPPAYIATSSGIRQVTPPVLTEANGDPYSTQNHAPSNPQASSTKGSAAPMSSTRIGKPRPQRPLTTITDNRQVDKIPILAFNDATNGNSSNRAGNGSSNAKAKGGDSNSTNNNTIGSGSGSSERYHLRGTGRSQNNSANNSPSSVAASNANTVTSASSTAANQQNVRPAPPPHSASSPSRLPQRVPRRKAAAASAARTAGHLGVAGPASHPPSTSSNGSTAPVVVTRSASSSAAKAAAKAAAAAQGPASQGPTAAPPVPSTRLGRNVRRRRSSTGEVA